VSTGIITAVWSGLFAAAFGSCHYNIVGPTAALSGLLAAAVDEVQTPLVLPFLCLVSSLTMFVVWLMNWQRFVMFIPSSVIHGYVWQQPRTGRIPIAVILSGVVVVMVMVVV
jgi:sulfate permease, SulP family